MECNTTFLDTLHDDHILLYDGAMGTMLQAASDKVGDIPDLLNLTDPDAVKAVHAAYVAAGSEVVTTNTFRSNARKLAGEAEVSAVYAAAVQCAKEAGARFVAADIGPIGEMMEPLGTLSFEDAYALYAEMARAAQDAGADLIAIETMSDLLETKAAVLAAKENTSLPVHVSMTFTESGRTFLGVSPAAAAVTLEGIGADLIGVNCSLEPKGIAPVVKEVLETVSCPVIVQANAGLPQVVDGEALYAVGAQEYADEMKPLLDAGVDVIGGCCGTSPVYIQELARVIENRTRIPHGTSTDMSIASAQNVVKIGEADVYAVSAEIVAGAVEDEDVEDIVDEALDAMSDGADVLELDLSGLDISYIEPLTSVLAELQGSCTLPIIFKAADSALVEEAVRAYAGKPGVRVLDENGNNEELAKHYGCVML